MKVNSILLTLAAAFSVAQGLQINEASDQVADIAPRAPEAVAQQHGPPPNMGGGGGGSSSGSGGGESGGSSGSSESSGSSGSSNNNNNNNDDDCDDNDRHCNSALGRSAPLFAVGGVAIAIAALL